MKLWVVAVGQRLPAWAETACADYLKRFGSDMPLALRTVRAATRHHGDATAAIKQEEQAINAAIPKGVHRVVCDERGQRVTTEALAKRLQRWQQDARDVTLIIGGADGLSAEWRDACDEQLRLSDLTLPHALARVLVLEQLYRAWSLNHGHPYHRA